MANLRVMVNESVDVHCHERNDLFLVVVMGSEMVMEIGDEVSNDDAHFLIWSFHHFCPPCRMPPCVYRLEAYRH